MLQRLPNKSLKERMCKKVRKQRWEQMLDSLMIVVMCRAQDAPWAQGISLLKEWWTTGRPGVVSARLEIGSPEGIGGGSSGHVDVAPASLTMGDASGGADSR